MKQLAVSGERLAVWQRIFLTFCLLLTAYCSLSCGSVPNLEAPECTESRGAVKDLYSFHFGNDMRFSPENLQKREKFFTPEYFKKLKEVQTDYDIFTTNDVDFPKAFRVGKCEVVESTKTNFEVLLFWKTDTRSEERKIKIEVVKQGDKWLVNKILN